MDLPLLYGFLIGPARTLRYAVPCVKQIIPPLVDAPRYVADRLYWLAICGVLLGVVSTKIGHT